MFHGWRGGEQRLELLLLSHRAQQTGLPVQVDARVEDVAGAGNQITDGSIWIQNEAESHLAEFRQALTGVEVVRILHQGDMVTSHPFLDHIRAPADRSAGGIIGLDHLVSGERAPQVFGKRRPEVGDVSRVHETGFPPPLHHLIIGCFVGFSTINQILRAGRGRVGAELVCIDGIGRSKRLSIRPGQPRQ